MSKAKGWSLEIMRARWIGVLPSPAMAFLSWVPETGIAGSIVPACMARGKVSGLAGFCTRCSGNSPRWRLRAVSVRADECKESIMPFRKFVGNTRSGRPTRFVLFHESARPQGKGFPRSRRKREAYVYICTGFRKHCWISNSKRRSICG